MTIPFNHFIRSVKGPNNDRDQTRGFNCESNSESEFNKLMKQMHCV